MMRKRYNIVVFIFSGLYGCLGEIIINFFSNLIRGENLWTYYNGGSTSWESFILFGIAGVLAFNIFLFISKRKEFFLELRQKIF